MKYFFFGLLIGFVSLELQAGGGLPHDVVERIRAVEDPEYREHLEKERERERELRSARVERSKWREEEQKKIARQRAAQVKYRKKYMKDVDAEFIEKEMEKEEREIEKQREIGRKKFVKTQRVLRKKIEQKQAARIREFRNQRMPASEPPERVDKKKRRF